MEYRQLGRTGLMVSEIGFGGEWMGGKPDDEVRALCDHCLAAGVNLLDCWMADPQIRSALGAGIAHARDRWIVQGHAGAVWQDGQYVRTRDMTLVRPAFEDLLARLRTDYLDLGMIHYVDDVEEYRGIMDGPFLAYLQELRAAGTVRHIGLSTHNPQVAQLAAEDGRIEAIMFSVNPAFDLLPATASLEDVLADDAVSAGVYAVEGLAGMDPVRERLYATCAARGVGLTVMKGYAGGRLLAAETSPFGVALTPVQCLHYALTRPAVASVLVGAESCAHIDDAVAYETASPAERDYASVLAGAPAHAWYGQCTYCGHCAPCSVGIDIAQVNKFYDLAVLQPDAPSGAREHYRDLPVRADACTACALCEPRCPFGVSIAERMAQAAELFG